MIVFTFITSSAGPGFATIVQAAVTREAAPVESLPPENEQDPTATPDPGPTVTPTAPPVPGIQPGATITPTATITATITATPPIILTSAPTATEPTTVITPTTPVTLTLSSASPFLTPGGQISVNWDIANFDTLPQDPNLLLAITAPAGFTLKGNTSGDYDPETNTLTFTPDKDKGKVKWVAGDNSYGPYVFSAVLSYAGQGLSAAALTVDEQNVFAIGQSGGKAVALVRGITVTVDIPSGALPEPIDLRIIPPGEISAPPEAPSGLPVRITATGQTTGLPVTQFAGEITISLSYNEAQLLGDESTLVLQYYDIAGGFWSTLPSWVDQENNSVVGFSDHLTDFDVDVQGWESATLPSLSAFQVSAFSGAASY